VKIIFPIYAINLTDEPVANNEQNEDKFLESLKFRKKEATAIRNFLLIFTYEE